MFHMTNRYFLIIALVVVFLPPFAAESFACSGGRCWGAVAAGPNGAWANAYDYASERGAIRAVQGRCRGKCTQIKTFFNTCGAIAMGDRGGWGWAWHGNQNEAQSRAIAYCVPNDRNCRVRTWACTTR